jgi:hypothetical protein
MLAELARREKEANIRPDPDIDIFMKVSKNLLSLDPEYIMQSTPRWRKGSNLKYNTLPSNLPLESTP